MTKATQRCIGGAPRLRLSETRCHSKRSSGAARKPLKKCSRTGGRRRWVVSRDEPPVGDDAEQWIVEGDTPIASLSYIGARRRRKVAGTIPAKLESQFAGGSSIGQRYRQYVRIGRWSQQSGNLTGLARPASPPAGEVVPVALGRFAMPGHWFADYPWIPMATDLPLEHPWSTRADAKTSVDTIVQSRGRRRWVIQRIAMHFTRQCTGPKGEMSCLILDFPLRGAK